MSLSDRELDPAGPFDRGSLERLGLELTGAFREALAAVAASSGAGVAAAEALGVSELLHSRLVTALDLSAPLEALLELPGPGPQRAVLDGLRRAGCPEGPQQALGAAIQRFEALVTERFGDLQRLHEALAAWVPGALARQVPAERQAVHRSLVETEGLALDASSFSLLYLPTEDGRFRVASQYSALGITRWRADAQFEVQIYHQVSRGRRGLDGRTYTEHGLSAYRQDAFCVRPPGPFRIQRLEPVHEFHLGATEPGREGAVDLRMVQVAIDPVKLASPTETRAAGPSFSAEYPMEHAFLEAVCPLDFRDGAAPRHLCYSTLVQGEFQAGDPRGIPALRSSLEPVEEHRFGDAGASPSALPRHAELLEHALRCEGHDPAGFRIWRVALRRPLPWLESHLVWVHPEAAPECLEPAQEAYA